MSECSLTYSVHVPQPRLSREDRREQILDAVLDVAIEHGMAVTSKQLAEAAGVSEGMIFKVFGTKEALLRELANRNVLRPHGVSAWLASADVRSLTLEQLVKRIIAVAVDDYRISFKLFAAFGTLIDNPSQADIDSFDNELRPWTEALEAHAVELRLEPPAAASVLRMHAIAAADTNSVWSTNMSPDDHAAVFLHGIAASDAPNR